MGAKDSKRKERRDAIVWDGGSMTERDTGVYTMVLWGQKSGRYDGTYCGTENWNLCVRLWGLDGMQDARPCCGIVGLLECQTRGQTVELWGQQWGNLK